MAKCIRRRSCFTLMEVVIVLVIIGVVAMIAVPRLSQAASGSRDAAVLADVRAISAAIELYRVEHDGRTPAHDPDRSFNLSGLVFADRLTQRTDEFGQPGNSAGPYLRQLPANPYNGLATIRIDGDPAGQNTHGWWYSSTYNIVLPDDSSYSAAQAFIAIRPESTQEDRVGFVQGAINSMKSLEEDREHAFGY